MFSLCLREGPSFKPSVDLLARAWSCWVPSCSLCLWLETFFGSLPSQPATYSLNSNNHIQIRFAVKQHLISFRNRKNENMYRKAFIPIHSNRMQGYNGSWKHMVQRVNICWEPLLLRSDPKNPETIFSIHTGNDYFFRCFNSHKNLIWGWPQVLISFGFNHWISTLPTHPLTSSLKFQKSNYFCNSNADYFLGHSFTLLLPSSSFRSSFIYSTIFPPKLKHAGPHNKVDKRIRVSLCCRNF